MFYYIPCEPYKERWTEFVSSEGGMVETLLKTNGIRFTTLRPTNDVYTISSGVVLDTIKRCNWAFQQIIRLVELIDDGTITSNDVLYFEDFWTPGMEMVPYACSMKGITPRVYSFCHAQSVDPHDFTAKMASWMRSFEKAWAHCNTRIFTAAPELCKMLEEGFSNSMSSYKFAPVGTIFDLGTLYQYAMVPDDYVPMPTGKRPLLVAYTSRPDKEKNFNFFIRLAEEILRSSSIIDFVVCTGREKLFGSDEEGIASAEYLANGYGKRFTIRTGLSKYDYYQVLQTAKVQFNCADQDFVSYTLLEAAAFGCLPLYPNYLTFPAAVNYNSNFLYRKGDLVSAKEKLMALMGTTSSVRFSDIYGKYQLSFRRMLDEMDYKFEDGPQPKLVDVLKR